MMFNKKSFLYSLVACSLLIACSDKDDLKILDSDYFLFGEYYGQCYIDGECCDGETCVEIFKIENTQLFEDTNDNFPPTSAPYEGNYIILADSTYQIVNNLLDEIPRKLFKESKSIIGCPDCSDGGGIYIEVSRAGEVRYWLIDRIEENLPKYLIPFRQSVVSAIENINS